MTYLFFSKIYDTELLQSAVKDIAVNLIACEDVYLNFLALFDNKCINISVRPEAYYIFKKGVGFSASDKFAHQLLQEYENIKPIIARRITAAGIPDNALWQMHIESIYFVKVSVDDMIRNKKI